MSFKKITLASLILASLTACGGGSSGGASSHPSTPIQPTLQPPASSGSPANGATAAAQAGNSGADASSASTNIPTPATNDHDSSENAANDTEAARLEKEKAEAARLEKEKAEAARLEKEKAEAARLEKEKAEAARLEKEKAEVARLEKEKAEAARLEIEKAEAARLEKEKAEAARLEKEKAEAARLEKEKAEAARLEKEKAERIKKDNDFKARLTKAGVEEHLVKHFLENGTAKERNNFLYALARFEKLGLTYNDDPKAISYYANGTFDTATFENIVKGHEDRIKFHNDLIKAGLDAKTAEEMVEKADEKSRADYLYVAERAKQLGVGFNRKLALYYSASKRGKIRPGDHIFMDKRIVDMHYIFDVLRSVGANNDLVRSFVNSTDTLTKTREEIIQNFINYTKGENGHYPQGLTVRDNNLVYNQKYSVTTVKKDNRGYIPLNFSQIQTTGLETASDRMPNEGVATYYGNAYGPFNQNGKLRYTVNFGERIGEGMITTERFKDGLILEHGRIVGNTIQSSIRSGNHRTEYELHPAGGYEIKFFGPNAEEIGGKAAFGDYMFGLAGSRQ